MSVCACMVFELLVFLPCQVEKGSVSAVLTGWPWSVASLRDERGKGRKTSSVALCRGSMASRADENRNLASVFFSGFRENLFKKSVSWRS